VSSRPIPLAVLTTDASLGPLPSVKQTSQRWAYEDRSFRWQLGFM